MVVTEDQMQCWSLWLRRGFDSISFHSHIDFLICVGLLGFITKYPLLMKRYKDFAALVLVRGLIAGGMIVLEGMTPPQCKEWPILIKLATTLGFLCLSVMQAVILALILRIVHREFHPINKWIIAGVPIFLALFPIYTSLVWVSFDVLDIAEYIRCFTGLINIIAGAALVFSRKCSTHFPLIVLVHELAYIPFEFLKLASDSDSVHVLMHEIDGFGWWVSAAFAIAVFIYEIRKERKEDETEMDSVPIFVTFDNDNTCDAVSIHQ